MAGEDLYRGINLTTQSELTKLLLIELFEMVLIWFKNDGIKRFEGNLKNVH